MELIRFFKEYPQVKAYMTTREGGFSTGEFSTLNMGYNTGDDKTNVDKNRLALKEYLGIKDGIEVIPNQVHKTDIAVIDFKDINTEKTYYPGDFDGIITKQKNVLLTTGYADCIPILLFDPVKNVVGLAHCGWKGTVYKCGKNAVDTMVKNFGSAPKDIICEIGVGIGFCCFETDENVYNIFKENFANISNFSKAIENNKFLIDLKGINKYVLECCGVEKININTDCTSCNTDKYFSYRKENGKTGRMCTGIILV